MFGKKTTILCIALGIMMAGLFSGAATASAKTLGGLSSMATTSLPNKYTGIFSQNDISYWDPCEGGGKQNWESCFKIDSNVSAQGFWYAEGCLNTGDCTSGAYYAAHSGPKADDGLVVSQKNPNIYDWIETDNDLGGMQYIYAENYDIDLDNWKLTPNGGNSTQKYYWIVLPAEAYSNGFGETFVATFENSSDPIYFIVFDTHACEHQDYCNKATADPDGVEAGEGFLGAFTKNAGSPTEAANILGKLTSLCRLSGNGEVLASSNPNGGPSASGSTSGSSSSDSDYSSEDGSNVTIIGDSMMTYSQDFYKAFDDKLPKADMHYKVGKSFNNSVSGNESGLEILRKLVEQDKLRKILVFALGSNNGPESVKVTQENIDELLELAKDCDKIILLTNYKSTDEHFFDSNNALFEKTANNDDKIILVDWKSEASKDPAKYIAAEGTFGIHPSEDGADLWAKLIYEAITKSDSSICGGGGGGNFSDYVIRYAWPEYRDNDINKEDYQTDQLRRKSEGIYTGSNGGLFGGTHPDQVGVDCGGFVTAITQESGMDKEYNNANGNTQYQIAYAKEHYERVTDTSQLQPGDVAFSDDSVNPGHTWIYVGEVDGFGSNIASASWGSRSPCAGNEGTSGAWYHNPNPGGS